MPPMISRAFRPYAWLPTLSTVDNVVHWHMIGAALSVAAVLHWPLLQSIFGSRGGRFLGRISFVLYLIHIPIICSFTAWSILTLQSLAVPAPLQLSAAATIAVVFAMAAATNRVLDEKPTRFSRMVGYTFDSVFPMVAGALQKS